MAWDFETEPEFQEKLDWADAFVREEVEPLDLVFPHQAFVPLDENRRKVIDPLKDEVRRQDLWATHLGPELDASLAANATVGIMSDYLWRRVRPTRAEIAHVTAFCLAAVSRQE